MHRRGFQQSLQTQAIEILRVYGTAVHGYVSSLTAVYRLTRGTLSNFSPETANVIWFYWPMYIDFLLRPDHTNNAVGIVSDWYESGQYVVVKQPVV